MSIVHTVCFLDSLYIQNCNDFNPTFFRSGLSWNEQVNQFLIHQHIAWWTGYFTSRANLKLYLRSRETVLRASEMFYVFAKGLNFAVDYDAAMYNISFLRHAIDTATHHDAITGTETHDVATNYLNRMADGTQRVHYWDESVVGHFLSGSKGETPKLLHYRNVNGDMFSKLSGNNVVVVVAFNSLAWTVTELLQIPSNRSDLVVFDSNQKVIPSQINPVAEQEQNGKYPAKFNLFILAQNMDPFAFHTFFIGVATSKYPASIGKVVSHKAGESLVAGNGSNGYYSITIDGATNRLSKVTHKILGRTFNVENQLSQYTPLGGIYNDHQGQTSGAYLFRPATDNRITVDANNDGKTKNKKMTEVFRMKFKSLNPSPGFIVQTHSNADPHFMDTFSVTVCGMDLKADPPTFDYQFYRVNGDKWGQKPIIDFLVFDQEDPTYSPVLNHFPNTQSGSILVQKAGIAVRSGNMLRLELGSASTRTSKT